MKIYGPLAFVIWIVSCIAAIAGEPNSSIRVSPSPPVPDDPFVVYLAKDVAIPDGTKFDWKVFHNGKRVFAGDTKMLTVPAASVGEYMIVATITRLEVEPEEIAYRVQTSAEGEGTHGGEESHPAARRSDALGDSAANAESADAADGMPPAAAAVAGEPRVEPPAAAADLIQPADEVPAADVPAAIPTEPVPEVDPVPPATATPDAASAAADPIASGAAPGTDSATSTQVPSAANIAAFQQSIQQRIIALEIPNDALFTKRSTAIAAMIDAVIKDTTIEGPTELQAAMLERTKQVYGKINSAKLARMWEQLLSNDAPKLAARHMIPMADDAEYRAYLKLLSGGISKEAKEDNIKGLAAAALAKYIVENGIDPGALFGSGEQEQTRKKCKLLHPFRR